MDVEELEFCEDDTSSNFESIVTSNDLILERILYFMTFDDLLSSAVINKRWNILSRSELRRNRKCLAKIDNDNPCQCLLNLKDQFEGNSKLPFQGLSIDFNGHYSCISVQDSRSLECNEFWKTLPIKFLKVTLEHYVECLAMLVIKLLMRNCSEQIQELRVQTVNDSFGSLPEFFGIDLKIKRNWLPNLKFLEIREERGEEILHQLVAAAPNLKNISGQVRPHHLPKLMEMKKAQLITEFIFDPQNPEDADVLLRFAESKPKLQYLIVKELSIETEPWPTICASLLDCCNNSLEKLEIEILDLIFLTSSGKLISSNLKHLIVNFNERLDQQLGIFSLAKINYEFAFPNLESCQISSSKYLELYSEEQLAVVSAELRDNNNSYFCSTVKHVTISDNCFDSRTETDCQILVSVFPNVTNLEIKKCKQVALYLRYPLAMWQDLERICISTTEYPAPITNFDILFCGVSKEEWTYLGLLEKASPGFLQNLELVPTGPSLLHLKNLKSLKITVFHNETCPVPIREDFVLLSSLTGYLVFSRMPQLKVNLVATDCTSKLQNTCRLAFEDMHDFARISECKMSD